MPAKKPKDDAPQAEPHNPATDAHRAPATAKPDTDMDADLEAKRSGPPAADRTMPKPMADPDAGFEKPAQQHHADTEAPADAAPEDWAAVEAKLKDPSFDPEGHERLRLAEESRSHPSDPNVPVTSDVDEHGDPMDGEPHR